MPNEKLHVWVRGAELVAARDEGCEATLAAYDGQIVVLYADGLTGTRISELAAH